MKAIFISPASKTVELVDVADNSAAWREKLGADRVALQTINQHLGLIALVDDNGIEKGLPSFSLFVAALNIRTFLHGDTLIIKSAENGENEATETDIDWLDICF